jgi:hypothetical protein
VDCAQHQGNLAYQPSAGAARHVRLLLVVVGSCDELSRTGIADGGYSSIGLGGNYLTVLPGLNVVVTVLTDSGATPLTDDAYHALVADLGAVLS